MAYLYKLRLALTFIHLTSAVIFASRQYTLFNILNDSKMESFKDSVSVRSSSDCGFLCRNDRECKSFSYQASTNTCMTHDINPNTHYKEFERSHGISLYVKGKDCKDGWEEFWGSCYLFSTSYRTWTSAKSYCKSLDAYLTIVAGKEENQFIRNHILQTFENVLPFFWIGAQYDEDEREYKWIDDSEIEFDGWAPSRPEDESGCVQYSDAAKWFWLDVPDCSSTPGPFICEMS